MVFLAQGKEFSTGAHFNKGGAPEAGGFVQAVEQLTGFINIIPRRLGKAAGLF